MSTVEQGTRVQNANRIILGTGLSLEQDDNGVTILNATGEQGTDWSLLTNVPDYAQRWPTLAEIGAAPAPIANYAWTQAGTTTAGFNRFTTPNGYIQLGPANTAGVAHIYTDQDSFYFNKMLSVMGSVVWHQTNDGAGSGMDADLLDGQQGSYYLSWLNLTNKPATFTPSPHTHPWSDIQAATIPVYATRWPTTTELSVYTKAEADSRYARGGAYTVGQNLTTSDSPTFAGGIYTSAVNIRGDLSLYTTSNNQHALSSRDRTGTASDDIRFNSLGEFLINLDSNNNNASAADFRIGRHGLATTISDWLFTVDGETGTIWSKGGASFGADLYVNVGWVRVLGNTGIWFETYSGGWHMQDNDFIRANVGIYSPANVTAPIFYDANNTGYYVDPDSTSTIKSVVMDGNLSFGTVPRQMLNLYGTTYALGVQSGTFYQRTDGNFAWFKDGTHSDVAYDPGAGGTLLARLDSNGYFVAKKYYDIEDLSYVLDPAGASVLSSLTVNSGITVAAGGLSVGGDLHVNNGTLYIADAQVHPTVISTSSPVGVSSYPIGTLFIQY